MLTIAVHVVAALVIALGLLQGLIHLVQLAMAAAALRDNPPEPRTGIVWRRSVADLPPISVLAPAYNEEATIVESVRSLLSLSYPHFEIIVINDGSKDQTLAAIHLAFDLEPLKRENEGALAHAPVRGIYTSTMHPNLLVIDKENGGKADALNAGINQSRNPVFCSMDADSILERDALLRAVQPFIDDPEHVVASGGTVRIANGCRVRSGQVAEVGLPRNPLALFQTVEYLRAFLMARLAWSRIGVLMIISGAFGLFRRSAVVEAGGYRHDTVGEDMELVVRLHRHFRERKEPYRIAYVPEPVCWTEAPETLAVLGRQRARWQRGALETFSTHRAMLFNPRYGRIGVIGFGSILVVDVLGPLAELAGYLLLPAFWAMGLLSTPYLAAFLAVTFAFGVAISVGALALEESELRRVPRARDLVVLTAAAVAENFGYRQLNTLWRIQGGWQWLRGAKAWGEMKRVGFAG